MLQYLRDRYVLTASLLLLGQAAIYYSIAVTEHVPSVPPWSEFPSELGGWRATTDSLFDPAVLAALKPDDYLDRNYTSSTGDRPLNLMIVYFRTRRSGHAPHSPQWCLPGSGWQEVSQSVVHLSIPDQASPQPVNEYIVQKGTSKQFVIYWYHQGTHVVTNEVVAQVYALPEMIFHGRTDTALVRIMTPISGGNTDGARAQAFAFARTAFPAIRQRIQ